MLTIVLYTVITMPLMNSKDPTFFFFSSRRRHTRLTCDWSSDVCSSDLSSLRTQPGCAWLIRLGLGYPGSLPIGHTAFVDRTASRSEERRVGKECRSRWSGDDLKKKKREGPSETR